MTRVGGRVGWQCLVIIISIFALFKRIFTPWMRSSFTDTGEIGTGCDESQLLLAPVEAVADLTPYTQCCGFINTRFLICLTGVISFCKTPAERKKKKHSVNEKEKKEKKKKQSLFCPVCEQLLLLSLESTHAWTANYCELVGFTAID